MQEATQLTFQTEPVGNVLYSRHYLKRLKQAVTLESQAKEAARRIVHDANCQAEATLDQAKKAGFQQGLLMWIDIIAEQLTGSNSRQQSFNDRLEDCLAERLRRFFNESPVILQIIEKWRAENKISHDAELSITIPENRKYLVPFISSALKEGRVNSPEILFTDESDFLIKSGIYVLSFRPDNLSHKLAREMIDESFDIKNLVKNGNIDLLNAMKAKLDVLEKEIMR